MANDERPVVMTIPEDMMRATIQAAVAQALANGNPDRFIRELVDSVLSKKADNYGRETLLDKTIGEMIKKVAEEFCAKYVETLRPMIHDAVETRLKNRKKFATEIADKLVDSISGNIRASISISVASKEGRY